MLRTIARIWPLTPAFAAVYASVLVSLVILQPPAERPLPGAAPADRGHVGALVLRAPHVARSVVHRQVPAHVAPVVTASLVPSRQTLRPPAPSSVSHTQAPKAKTPTPKPKTKPTTPTPTPPPIVAPPAPTTPTQPAALKQHGHGPPAHSNSHLLAVRKQSERAAPKGKAGHNGPPPGHGKLSPTPPPPPPPAAALVQPAGPPATPPGHGGTAPGHGGTPPGQGGTPPGHDKH